jgi:hypothetical protein
MCLNNALRDGRNFRPLPPWGSRVNTGHPRVRRKSFGRRPYIPPAGHYAQLRVLSSPAGILLLESVCLAWPAHGSSESVSHSLGCASGVGRRELLSSAPLRNSFGREPIQQRPRRPQGRLARRRPRRAYRVHRRMGCPPQLLVGEAAAGDCYFQQSAFSPGGNFAVLLSAVCCRGYPVARLASWLAV